MYRHYILFPNINPIILSKGCICIHWYGLMYVLGFITSCLYCIKNKEMLNNCTSITKIKDLFYNCFIGAIIGARIGYILFYAPDVFIANPLTIFKIWNGGMSFHGGLIGIIIVMMHFSYKEKINFFKISDFVSISAPISIVFGRIGNFINGELWGRVNTYLPWAMLFPKSHYLDMKVSTNNLLFQKIIFSNDYHVLPRHPSQIYEMIFEGIILFFILKICKKIKMSSGWMSGIFLFFYGIFRCIMECFRQPDKQIYIPLIKEVTVGQILSFPMIISGIIIFLYKFYDSSRK